MTTQSRSVNSTMNPETLKSELDRRGLSLSQAAAALRVDRQTVWRYLHGEIAISEDRADLIQLRLEQYDRA